MDLANNAAERALDREHRRMLRNDAVQARREAKRLCQQAIALTQSIEEQMRLPIKERRRVQRDFHRELLELLRPEDLDIRPN